MFQRLQKGLNLDFLDSKIAEEQEKQKHQQHQVKVASPAKRAPGSAGTTRASGRTDSPNKRTSRLRVNESGSDGIPATKGPDPDNFVIGDDVSDFSPSRAATPVQPREDAEIAVEGKKVDENQEESIMDDKGKEKLVQDEVRVGDKGKKRLDQDELPLDVLQKLARLETLTAKYQDLLRNYRTAHAHVAAIEPFEATLREHTPLTSISDPGALVEFLSQRSLQSEMVMDELKRVSEERKEAVKERDELKVKLDEAEKKAREAFDEAAGLRHKCNEATSVTAGKKRETSDPLGSDNEVKHSEPEKKDDTFFSYEEETSRTETDNLDQEAKAQELKPVGEGKAVQLKTEHIASVSELKKEMEEQRAYIDELSTENASMRHDLEVTRINLDAMENKLGIRESELCHARTELAGAKSQLAQATAVRDAAQKQEEEATVLLAQTEREVINLQQKVTQHQQELDRSNQDLVEKLTAAQATIKKLEEERAEHLKSGKDAQREAKRMQTLMSLVNTLKEQVKKAEESKKAEEAKVNDLHFEIKKLESEVSTSGALIRHLRQQESATGSLKTRILEVEQERDQARRLADSKKGHEAAAASLRSQLKRAESDRDAAYQMILDCGKCKDDTDEIGPGSHTPTEGTVSTPMTSSRPDSDATEASTLPTESSSPVPPSVDGSELVALSDAKKKNRKKKLRTKKKAQNRDASPTAQPDLTLDDLLLNPDLALDVLLKAKFGDNPMVPLFANIVAAAREKDEAKANEQDGLLQHHEAMIEELKQNIINKDIILRAKNDEIGILQESKATHTATTEGNVEKDRQIQSLHAEVAALRSEILAKDEQISKLQARLQGESSLLEQIESLTEEKESLQDDVLELGTSATDAKHGLKELKEGHAKLRQEFDELQQESDGYQKEIKDAEARCDALEAEIKDLKEKGVSSAQVKGMEERVRELERDKQMVQDAKEACEKQIGELKARQTTSEAELDAHHKSFATDLEALRAKAADSEKELAAAQQLSQTRFKDLTNIREQYNKLQPELKRLRAESAELKTAKAEVEKVNIGVKKAETKEKELRSEIAQYKSRLTEKDGEIISLKERAKKGEERSATFEESLELTRRSLKKSEHSRDEAMEKRDQLQSENKRLAEELKKCKLSVVELECQVTQLAAEASRVREELELKGAQQASAQSLMDSMQNQTRELTVRMKEAETRKDSLEEELADAHRLLSERGREGETMRRLLAEVEGRAENRVREMREQMELAIQERDRAEEEASAIGQRKRREAEEVKSKLCEAEREARQALEAKEEAERREEELQGKQEEIERRARQAQEEAQDMRTALVQLREMLEESERQCRSVERERGELRKCIAERDMQLEKLQKSSRSMAEEVRALQTGSKGRAGGGSVTPSRSSAESPGIPMPAPRGGGRTGENTAATAAKEVEVDYVYLKNVLLQFLEQKEKRHQMQLVPVLGMLLHFDPQEEQKWMAVISAK